MSFIKRPWFGYYPQTILFPGSEKDWFLWTPDFEIGNRAQEENGYTLFPQLECGEETYKFAFEINSRAEAISKLSSILGSPCYWDEDVKAVREGQSC